MIALALLTSSDYTEGIESIGAVRALEILGESGAQGTEALKKFRTSFDSARKRRSKGDFRPESKFRSSLISLDVPPNLPDNLVVQADLQPSVDDNKDKFTWGVPALDMLREYTRKKFGWKQNKCDDILLPIIKRLNLRSTQTHMESFFTVQLKPKEKMFSKRVGKALARMKSSDDLDQAGSSTSQPGKPKRAKKSLNGNSDSLDETELSTSKPEKPKRPRSGKMEIWTILFKLNLRLRSSKDLEKETSNPGFRAIGRKLDPRLHSRVDQQKEEKPGTVWTAESSNGTAATRNGKKRKSDASDEARYFSQKTEKNRNASGKARKFAGEVQAASEGN